jgi:hypothetical protein
MSQTRVAWHSDLPISRPRCYRVKRTPRWRWPASCPDVAALAAAGRYWDGCSPSGCRVVAEVDDGRAGDDASDVRHDGCVRSRRLRPPGRDLGRGRAVDQRRPQWTALPQPRRHLHHVPPAVGRRHQDCVRRDALHADPGRPDRTGRRPRPHRQRVQLPGTPHRDSPGLPVDEGRRVGARREKVVASLATRLQRLSGGAPSAALAPDGDAYLMR